MTVDFPVWTGDQWIQMEIPAMAGEAIVVPNVAAVVYDSAKESLLLQRRDKPGEVVQGMLELPGGRWGAGESAEEAVRREVYEETGVSVLELVAGSRSYDFPPGFAIEASSPAAVVAGLNGAYPALILAFECIGEGVPRALPGETAAPSWWRVGDVVSHLADDPDDFVWQTAAILREVVVPQFDS